METREYFRRRFAEVIAPVLRQDGFRGSAKDFRRQRGDVLQGLELQASRVGNRCYVNLGLHLAFLPDVVGKPVDPRRFRIPELEFRTRLPLPDEYQPLFGWPYGSSESEGDASLGAMLASYEQHDRQWLSRFSRFPEDWLQLTPDDLRDRRWISFDFGTTRVRVALTWMRIHEHLGDLDTAREFARVGLADSPGGIRAHFERVLADS
jgi:hypothetical protein